MGVGIINGEVQPEGGAPQTKDAFDEFLDALKQPKQNYRPIDEPPAEDPEYYEDDTDNPEESDDTYLTPEEIKTQRNNFEFSLVPAETIVECIDMGYCGVGKLIAKEEVEGATEDEKTNLTKAWADYLKDKNADLSPGWVLVIMLLIVYAPKIYTCFEVRKLNQENQELQAANEELAAQNEYLIRRMEAYDKKKKAKKAAQEEPTETESEPKPKN